MTPIEKTLGEQLTFAMQVGVNKVLRGEEEAWTCNFGHPGWVVDYLEGQGGATGMSNIIAKSWRWDWSMKVEVAGQRFQLSGSGYDGGVTFERAREG